MRAGLGPLVLGVAMFTAVPLPKATVPQADRVTTTRALCWLPLVGAALGAAAGAAALMFWRGHGTGSPLLGAAVAFVTLAALTRGLHLDGLADLVDGLGSRRPPAEALEIMRRSDIGPFGVVALIAVACGQIASLATIFAVANRAEGVIVVVVAAASGRLAAVVAARTGVPAARPQGFGALVAGAVGPARLFTAAGLVVAGAAGLALASGADGGGIAAYAGSVVLAQLVTTALLARVVRRIGGTTGDVFGAMVEVATTVTLLALAAVVCWHGAL